MQGCGGRGTANCPLAALLWEPLHSPRCPLHALWLRSMQDPGCPFLFGHCTPLSTTQPTAILSHRTPPPTCSYYMSLGILCGLILAAMPWAATGLSSQLGRARKENVSFAQLFKCVDLRVAAGCQPLSARGRAAGSVCSGAVACIGTTPAPPHFGRRNKPNVNILSLSRVFLFGARDLWFEVRKLGSSLPLLSPRLRACQLARRN